MPIQEGEEASGRPAAKAKPILKPASTSNRNFIPMRERKWIDIEVQKSKDPFWFQMSKFIAQLLRHKEVGWEEDARVPHDRIVEKCNEGLSKDSRYWSDEINEKWNVAPYWSARSGWTFCQKVVDRRKGFNIVWNQMNQKNSYTFEPFKVIQVKFILQLLVSILYCKTMYCYRRISPSYVYHVGHGNELRSKVRNGLVPGGFSTKTGRGAVFFTVVNPMDDGQGLRETFFAIYHEQEWRLTKILVNNFKIQNMVQVHWESDTHEN